MVSVTRDFTTSYNIQNYWTIDASDWDYVVVQFIGTVGTIQFTGTLDGGAITGQTLDSPGAVTNLTQIQGTNLATGSAGTSTSSDSQFKFSMANSSTRFIKLTGTANITKLLVYFAKIS